MNSFGISAVVCTKDRPHAIQRQLQRLYDLGSFRQIIVVDSSARLPLYLYDYSRITVLHTPNVTLGVARQTGLAYSTSPFTFFVDDDIRFSDASLFTLYGRMREGDSDVAAVCGIVVYGYPHEKVLMKLFTAGRSLEGHSIGYSILKNELVNLVGGFNPNVHIGEDFDLATRLGQYGYKWSRCKDALSYHSGTLREMIWKAFRAGQHFYLGRRHPLYWFGRLMGKLIIMPLYYAITGKDPRILIYYFLMNAARLYGFAWRYHHEVD